MINEQGTTNKEQRILKNDLKKRLVKNEILRTQLLHYSLFIIHCSLKKYEPIPTNKRSRLRSEYAIAKT